MSSIAFWARPHPAEIIRYVYLWRSEHERGLDDGRKTRPCLVLATYERAGQLRVITAPLTTRDSAPAHSVTIPPRVITHLGLDDRSRIVWNDLNEFTWVGPDVRSGADGGPLVGTLPEALWRQVVDKVVESRIRPTPRSE